MEDWMRESQRNSNKKKRGLAITLKELKETDLNDEVLAEIVNTKLELNLEADHEELYWEQCVRINWLRYRDQNTKFFSHLCNYSIKKK